MMNEEQINESVMKTIRFRILQIEKRMQSHMRRKMQIWFLRL